MTVHVRQFTTTFEVRDVTEDGDGRTVYGRIVPYGEVATFVDAYDGNKVKRERFARGSMGPQANAFNRVLLSFEHENGFINTIGYGRTLYEETDGAYGAFRLYKADADKAREMIRESHKGLSVEFEPMRSVLDEDGTIVRQRVHLRRVGIVPEGAYRGAEVLAVRGADHTAEATEPAEEELLVATPHTPHLDAVRADLAELRRGALDRLRRTL